MKAKIFMSLCGLFLIMVSVVGCGGGNNTSITAPSLKESNANEGASYFKGLKGLSQRLVIEDVSESSLAENLAKSKQSSVLFSDTFSDSTFTDGWLGPEINGNYAIVQKNGVLNISGDATQNPNCDAVACEGHAAIVSRTEANAGSPIVAEIDLDTTGSSAVSGSVSGAQLLLLDQTNQVFSLFIFASPDPWCQGTCLGFFHSNLPPGAPPVLQTNIASSGHLKIAYSNGIYIVSFNTQTFPNITGPVLAGGVRVALFGLTRYNLGFGINPADVTLQSKFDNASMQAGFFTPCDATLSQQRLQAVISSVQALISEMEANNVKWGFLTQAWVVLPRLNAALQSLQKSLETGAYENALNQLNGTLGPLREIQFSLQWQRGKNIPANLVDKWVNDIGAMKGEIKIVIEEARACVI